MDVYVALVDDLLAYARLDDAVFRCSRGDRGKWTCVPADETEYARASVVTRLLCPAEEACELDAPLRRGDMVQTASGERAVVELVNDGKAVVAGVPHSVDTVRRVPRRTFTTFDGNRYDIELLARLPSAMILTTESGARAFLCHGTIDPKLAEHASLLSSAHRLYLTSDGGYSASRADADPNRREYDGHVFKWGDMVENRDGSFDFAASLRDGRPAIGVDDLRRASDAIGVDWILSGHQDLVNVGIVHDGGPLPGAFLKSDNPRNKHYFNQLTVLEFDATTPNPLSLHARFVVTSSAVYCKRTDLDDATDLTLVTVCWLSLADDEVMVHHRLPKSAVPGATFQARVLDGLDFWSTVEFFANDFEHPGYQPGGKSPPGRDWSDKSRFFSKAYLDVVFGNALATLEDEAAHTVYVDMVRGESSERVALIGDLHSSIYALATFLMWCREQDFFDGMAVKPGRRVVFLGDMVGRGPYGLEIMALVFQLKAAAPTRVHVLDGNHETRPIYNRDGLSLEISSEYPFTARRAR